ncbi:MAG: hypothetical protein R3307_11035, partial [Anaerolineales bacterium]|nr:hypothetical protein [Anaerolineales bacterium]
MRKVDKWCEGEKPDFAATILLEQLEKHSDVLGKYPDLKQQLIFDSQILYSLEKDDLKQRVLRGEFDANEILEPKDEKKTA